MSTLETEPSVSLEDNYSLDQIGDFTYSTQVCGVASPFVPFCKIIQGVPYAFRTGVGADDCFVSQEDYPDDVQITVTEDTALFLIERLQQWLEERKAFHAQPALAFPMIEEGRPVRDC